MQVSKEMVDATVRQVAQHPEEYPAFDEMLMQSDAFKMFARTGISMGRHADEFLPLIIAGAHLGYKIRLAEEQQTKKINQERSNDLTAA